MPLRFDRSVSESPYSDLDRPPLSEQSLNRLLVRDGSLWRRIEVVGETGSTNADMAERAVNGAAEGTVLVAETQTAGRGRLGRRWSAPPRSGLMFSMVLRPGDHGVAVARQGWASLLVGVAVAAAVRKTTARAKTGRFAEGGEVAGTVVDAVVKWPNDVLVGERKLAGILAERAGDGLVVGVGLNVSLHENELPVSTATSLVIERASFVDREPLLRAVLRQVEDFYTAWCSVGGDPEAQPAGGYPAVAGLPVADSLAGGLRRTYRNLCSTLGRQVRVELPGDRVLAGEATDVDREGRLLVAGEAVSAGDVVHVRRT